MENNKFNLNNLVYGLHSVRSILEHNPKQILKVYFSYKSPELRLTSLINRIIKNNIHIQECTRHWLDIKSHGSLHQGIIAEINHISCLKEDSLSNFLMMCNKPLLLLILDGITDPHNLGACLRSADAAGVHLVVVPRNRSVHINGTVRKVASGSAERVPVMKVTNLSRTLKLLQEHDVLVIGTEICSNNVIFDIELSKSLALVVGSEGSGMRYLTKKNCNKCVNIPMLGEGKSLNVSVATGICLFEVLRQRRYKK